MKGHVVCSHTQGPGSVLRVKNNHAQLLCKGYNIMMSICAKFRETQYILVCTGTYWYELVHKHSSFESQSDADKYSGLAPE
jgi:hypothetical protein